jgi:hypothetical protein
LDGHATETENLPDGGPPAAFWLAEGPDEPEVIDGPEVIDLRDGRADDQGEDRTIEDVDDAGVHALAHADADVSLHRLLERAKPSLPEAASLAALVLQAVAALHEAGCAHGSLDTRSVLIGRDGDVRLVGWGPDGLVGTATGAGGDLRRADIRAAADMVAEIARSAGRPIRALTDREERMLARLATAADPRSLARRGPLRAAHGLEQAVGPAERRQTARRGVLGLRAAVAAADGPPTGSFMAFSGAGNGRGPGGTNRPGVPYERTLPAPARRRPISPKMLKILAVVATLVAVLSLELWLFGDSVEHNVALLLGRDAKAAEPGPKGPAPLPVFGPPAAGPVTHVELRPLDACKVGGACTAVVQVTVTPQDRPLDVTWGVQLFDRCGPTRETRPGGTLTVAPGQDRAVQTAAVPLPAARWLTIVPVTDAPTRVAGPALNLAPDDGHC